MRAAIITPVIDGIALKNAGRAFCQVRAIIRARLLGARIHGYREWWRIGLGEGVLVKFTTDIRVRNHCLEGIPRPLILHIFKFLIFS